MKTFSTASELDYISSVENGLGTAIDIAFETQIEPSELNRIYQIMNEAIEEQNQ
jgi:hypothetical protein